MRNYATIRPTFWTRGSGKKLRGDPEAQVLALYLFTCQQATSCGIFYIAPVTIAHETGLDISKLPGIFKRISELAEYDFNEELCWVPNMAREQIGDTLKAGDKRRPKLMKELSQFGDHQFISAFYHMYMVSFSLPTNKGHAALPDAPSTVQVFNNKKECPETAVTCPPDLALNSAQVANLEMAGCPRWAVDAMTADMRTKWLGSDERKTRESWVRYLAGAVTKTWNDPKKRPKKPTKAESQGLRWGDE